MREHGGYNSMDWPSNCQYFDVAVFGAGAAAPVAPTGTAYPFADGATPDFPKSANALSLLTTEIPTRSGVGLYVLTYSLNFKVGAILDVTPEVYGASGVWAQVASWNAANRTISVRTFNAAGAAVDLLGGGTPDLLVLTVKARDTSTVGAGKT